MNMTVYFKGGGKIPLVSFAENILHLAFCSQSMRLTILTDVAMQSNIRSNCNHYYYHRKYVDNCAKEVPLILFLNLQSQSDESGVASRI